MFGLYLEIFSSFISVTYDSCLYGVNYDKVNKTLLLMRVLLQRV